MFLYCLIGGSTDQIKIGISETHKRVFHLSTIYPVDFTVSFAMEYHDSSVVKALENLILKSTERFLVKNFLRLSSYKRNLFPGSTELRSVEALRDIAFTIFNFFMTNRKEVRFVTFFHHTCSECGAKESKFKYVKLEEIQVLKGMADYYNKIFSSLENKNTDNLIDDRKLGMDYTSADDNTSP